MILAKGPKEEEFNDNRFDEDVEELWKSNRGGRGSENVSTDCVA